MEEDDDYEGFGEKEHKVWISVINFLVSQEKECVFFREAIWENSPLANGKYYYILHITNGNNSLFCEIVCVQYESCMMCI